MMMMSCGPPTPDPPHARHGADDDYRLTTTRCWPGHKLRNAPTMQACQNTRLHNPPQAAAASPITACAHACRNTLLVHPSNHRSFSLCARVCVQAQPAVRCRHGRPAQLALASQPTLVKKEKAHSIWRDHEQAGISGTCVCVCHGVYRTQRPNVPWTG